MSTRLKSLHNTMSTELLTHPEKHYWKAGGGAVKAASVNDLFKEKF